MAVKTKQELLDSIAEDMPDNNAGKISAEDIRHNMSDTVESINAVVASGDHDSDFPFYNNVRASSVEGGGFFIAESGVEFPNSTGETTQTQAYPGPEGIDHNLLGNRNSSIDAHTQYLATNGERPMEENLPMGSNWINASGAGSDDRGLRFQYEDNRDDIHVGTSGNFVFSDGSKINNGRSVAKAWLNFDGSGVSGAPVIRSHHNIDVLQHLDTGKFKVTLPSGVVKDENFVAIGSSNSRTTASSQEDFGRNTVGITQREFEPSTGRASLTFLVLNEASEYVDAEINDLVVYGYDEGEENRPEPTIIPRS